MGRSASRETTEKRIILALEEIWEDYMKYNPDGNYLDLTIMRTENGVYFRGNNRYWPDGEDNHMPLEFGKEAV